MFPASHARRRRPRRSARAAHGLTVVELERKNKNKPWSYVKGAGLNRRYLTDTTLRTHRPGRRLAAGPDRGRPGRPHHPAARWATAPAAPPPGAPSSPARRTSTATSSRPGTSADDKRYGLTNKPTARQWELDDPRFDTRNPGYANEANRFGWIVEVDPFDPTSTPKKHSALGRFKHEGANVIVAESGHVVAYMGDDERFDYLYKFVSKGKYQSGNEGDRKHNMTLLSDGDLYVARFTGNSPASEITGTGTRPGRRRLRRHRRMAAARGRREVRR